MISLLLLVLIITILCLGNKGRKSRGLYTLPDREREEDLIDKINKTWRREE